MVMSPRRCTWGRDSTARQRATVSAPGAQPDLEASPEVLTWTWMLSFSGTGDDDEEGVVVFEGEEADEEEEVKEEMNSPR
jgi:hypothetical protein